MKNFTEKELKEVLRPITSLISKSEKSQQKLAPGIWQHKMLGDDIRALRHASTLIRRGKDKKGYFTRDDLYDAS